MTERKAVKNYVKAAGKGILKVMSKMGISTVASYTGAQIFEAVGLQRVARRRVLHRHRVAHRGHRPRRDRRRGRARATTSRTPIGPTELAHRELTVGGEYQWRREGEYHLFNPETVFKLQHSTRSGRYDVFKQYTKLVDDAVAPASPRCADCSSSAPVRAPPIPIDEVEPVAAIVKRFSSGAMSYGSISKEAHENIAIAMNRLGARSNTGEGGEDPDRFVRDAERRLAPQRDQAGRVGSLRRDERVPRERRRPADQDGAGREAGRGRRAARATRCTRGSRRRGTPRRASG